MTVILAIALAIWYNKKNFETVYWMICMNVYDFDGTIYAGDSSLDFYRFSLKKNPLIIRYVPKQIWGAILYCFKKIDKTKLKEYFFSFIRSINTDEIVNEFWQKNEYKIQKWYLNQQQADDIIVSASPEFLLKTVCDNLGIIHLVASRVDSGNGHFNSLNCKGKEKAKRLVEEYSVNKIECFYSDSISDQPLADFSDEAFFVSNGVLKRWK